MAVAERRAGTCSLWPSPVQSLTAPQLSTPLHIWRDPERGRHATKPDVTVSVLQQKQPLLRLLPSLQYDRLYECLRLTAAVNFAEGRENRPPPPPPPPVVQGTAFPFRPTAALCCHSGACAPFYVPVSQGLRGGGAVQVQCS
jgi:hypothetical protein